MVFSLRRVCEGMEVWAWDFISAINFALGSGWAVLRRSFIAAGSRWLLVLREVWAAFSERRVAFDGVSGASNGARSS